MKKYFYNYHPGLFVAKNNKIVMLTHDDVYMYYFNPKSHYFDPICLNQGTLKAFDFIRSEGEYRGQYFFTRNSIILTRRVGKSSFYCCNFSYSPDFMYLHELQDFFIFFYRNNYHYEIELKNFINNFGSKEIYDFDIDQYEEL